MAIQKNWHSGIAKIGLCVLGLSGISLGSIADESHEVSDGIELITEKGSVGSAEILAGDYDKAVHTIKTALILNGRHEKAVNLCVAYIMKNDFSTAEPHCRSAVILSRKVDSQQLESQQTRMASASWNNLGVLLALQGDLDTAHNYMQKAARLDRRETSKPSENLLALEERMSLTESVALGSAQTP